MNVDTQDINIVVDKETVEVKATDAKNSEISKSPAHNADSQKIEILAQAKQPETEIPTKAKVTDTEKMDTEKLAYAEVLTQTEEAKVIT